jgi:hypothetical protein
MNLESFMNESTAAKAMVDREGRAGAWHSFAEVFGIFARFLRIFDLRKWLISRLNATKCG